MSTPVMASEHDLRTLAGIVTDLRATSQKTVCRNPCSGI